MAEAEEKIILATIDCIEEFGIRDVTIRRIGEKAGMNSAAISYYFRSKDALMETVLGTTLNNAFRWEDFTYTEDMPLKDQLFEIFNFLSQNAVKFPRLAQAHFHEIIENGNPHTQTAVKLNAFLGRLCMEIKRKKPEMEDEEIRLALMQITSSTMLYFSTFSCISVDPDGRPWDEKAIERYVRRIVDKLI